MNIEPASGQCDHRLDVGFTFSAFTLVVGTRDRVATGCDLRGELAGTQQLSTVVPRSAQVTADPTGVFRGRCEPGDAGQTINTSEHRHVTARGSKKLRAERGSESGHTGQDLGVPVAAKSFLDEHFGFRDFVIEGDHLLGQSGDGLGRDQLAADRDMLLPGSIYCDLGDHSGLAHLAFTQPS